MSSPDVKYQLSENFINFSLKITGFSVFFTILVLIILLLFRPGKFTGDFKPDTLKDINYDYMIYTHIGFYTVSIFSLSLMIYYLNKKDLEADTIVFPTLVLALNVIANAIYYFYYSNVSRKNYVFTKDYLGMFYILLTSILFIFYMVLFIKSIKEKKRIRDNNKQFKTQEISNKKIIAQDFDKYFTSRGVRINETVKRWIMNYVETEALHSRDPIRDIDREMQDAFKVYNHGNTFYNDKELPPYSKFVENTYTQGMSPIKIMRDLKGNEYLNPKIIFYIDQLLSRPNTNKSMLDLDPETKQRANQLIKQMITGKQF